MLLELIHYDASLSSLSWWFCNVLVLFGNYLWNVNVCSSTLTV